MPRIKRKTAAPAPGKEAVFPWRWKLGDRVYALGHSDSLRVLGGELWIGCPHLHLIDGEGMVWRVPQLHTSSKAISGGGE